ncbi:hypothetical protein EJ110_NYTH19240 [Nymphaea thermarum]|nr:hypothetical protein EJ110_NYTH19240 [Nymphaea thermarum]
MSLTSKMVSEEDIIFHILRALPHEYAAFKIFVTSSVNPISLTELHSECGQEGQHWKGSVEAKVQEWVTVEMHLESGLSWLGSHAKNPQNQTIPTSPCSSLFVAGADSAGRFSGALFYPVWKCSVLSCLAMCSVLPRLEIAHQIVEIVSNLTQNAPLRKWSSDTILEH